MPKPTVIDGPYPTVDEVARLYGISAAERRRIERSVQQLLTRDAAASPAIGRGHARKAASRTARKK